MKEKELRELVARGCVFCGETPTKYAPMFFRVRLGTMTLDVQNIRQQSGLEVMLGSVALAQVMGADADLAHIMRKGVELPICINCINQINEIYEKSFEDEDKDEQSNNL